MNLLLIILSASSNLALMVKRFHLRTLATHPLNFLFRIFMILWVFFLMIRKFCPLSDQCTHSNPLVRMGFTHNCLKIIGKLWGGGEITKFIQTIFITSRIPVDLTRVKLVLIPKVPNLESVSHFRPISVCNTLYKLLTKIIVNKPKPFLHAMVHPAQSDFVPSRRATDNYITTQELIHYINRRKGKTNLMAAKINLDKAHDKLEWSFFKYTTLFLF